MWVKKHKHEIILVLWLFLVLMMVVVFLVIFVEDFYISDGLQAMQCLIEIIGLGGLGIVAIQYINSLKTAELEPWIPGESTIRRGESEFIRSYSIIDVYFHRGKIRQPILHGAELLFPFSFAIANLGPLPANYIKATIIKINVTKGMAIYRDMPDERLIRDLGVNDSYWEKTKSKYGNEGPEQSFYGKEDFLVYGTPEENGIDDLFVSNPSSVKIGSFKLIVPVFFAEKPNIQIVLSVQARGVPIKHRFFSVIIPSIEEVLEKAKGEELFPRV